MVVRHPADYPVADQPERNRQAERLDDQEWRPNATHVHHYRR